MVSFEAPEYTANVMLGTLRILEAVRICGLAEKPAFTKPTSELYGLVQENPHPNNPFHPRSPYGSEAYAYWITQPQGGIQYACTALFNHESPRAVKLRNSQDHSWTCPD